MIYIIIAWLGLLTISHSGEDNYIEDPTRDNHLSFMPMQLTCPPTFEQFRAHGYLVHAANIPPNDNAKNPIHWDGTLKPEQALTYWTLNSQVPSDFFSHTQFTVIVPLIKLFTRVAGGCPFEVMTLGRYKLSAGDMIVHDQCRSNAYLLSVFNKLKKEGVFVTSYPGSAHESSDKIVHRKAFEERARIVLSLILERGGWQLQFKQEQGMHNNWSASSKACVDKVNLHTAEGMASLLNPLGAAFGYEYSGPISLFRSYSDLKNLIRRPEGVPFTKDSTTHSDEPSNVPLHLNVVYVPLPERQFFSSLQDSIYRSLKNFLQNLKLAPEKILQRTIKNLDDEDNEFSANSLSGFAKQAFLSDKNAYIIFFDGIYNNLSYIANIKFNVYAPQYRRLSQFAQQLIFSAQNGNFNPSDFDSFRSDRFCQLTLKLLTEWKLADSKGFSKAWAFIREKGILR